MLYKYSALELIWLHATQTIMWHKEHGRLVVTNFPKALIHIVFWCNGITVYGYDFTVRRYKKD